MKIRMGKPTSEMKHLTFLFFALSFTQVHLFAAAQPCKANLTFAQLLKPASYGTALREEWQPDGSPPTLIRKTVFDEYRVWVCNKYFTSEYCANAVATGIDYQTDLHILRPERWLVEASPPFYIGRLPDYGSSREGNGDRDLTNSKDGELLAACVQFETLLKDLPAPRIGSEGQLNDQAIPKGKAENVSKRKAEKSEVMAFLLYHLCFATTM